MATIDHLILNVNDVHQVTGSCVARPYSFGAAAGH